MTLKVASVGCIVALCGCSLMGQPGAESDGDMALAGRARDELRACAVAYASSHDTRRLTGFEVAQASVGACSQYANQVERYTIAAAADRSRRAPGSIDPYVVGTQARELAEQGARDAVLQAIADRG